MVWPDSAENDFRRELSKALENLNTLNIMNVKTYLLEITPAEQKTRDKLAKSVHNDISTLANILEATDVEISYSEFSIHEFKDFVTRIKRLQQFLLAVYGNLKPQEIAMRSSKRFKREFLEVLREPLMNLAAGCDIAIKATRRKLDPDHKLKIFDLEARADVVTNIPHTRRFSWVNYEELLDESLTLLEEKQFVILQNMFNLDFETASETASLFSPDLRDDQLSEICHENQQTVNTVSTLAAFGDYLLSGNVGGKKVPKDANFLVDFFMFGIREYVTELLKLRRSVLGLHPCVERKKAIRFQFRTLIPVSLSRGHDSTPYVEKSKPVLRRHGPSSRERIAHWLSFFVNPIGVYGLKNAVVACIVISPLLIGGQFADFFIDWNIVGSAIPMLVTLSPVQGQSFISFAFQLIGNVIGSMWGYLCLVAWGKSNLYGLSFFIILYAFFMGHFSTMKTKFYQGSLISMLSFSNVMVGEYVNRHNPSYDPPIVKAYKTIAVTAMIVAIVFVFQVLIYPNYARRQLRHQISDILQNFRFYYIRHLQIPARLMDKQAAEKTIKTINSDCHKRELKLQSQLLELQPLLIFANAEPRLAGPFQLKTYKKIIYHLQMVLDRLSWARTSIGTSPFSEVVIDNLYLPLAGTRRKVAETNRILFYTYATAMKSKLPLPDVLPSSTTYRDAWFQNLLEVSKDLRISGVLGDDPHAPRNEEFLRYYALTLAMRGMAVHLDEMAGCLKKLFGISEESITDY